MIRPSLTLVLLALLTVQLCSSTLAATRTWVGGNDPWDGDIFNWSGIDEPDPDDDVVFNTNNHVEMAMNNEILSLDLSTSIELDTESYFLDVNGNITLSGAGTLLRAGESNTFGLPATSVSAYNLVVNAGATYANANFSSIVDPAGIGVLDINTDGTLTGHGVIRNGDGIGSSTNVFVNDGVIRPGTVSDGFILVGGTPTARTLTLEAVDGEARIDLDGVSGSGAVDIARNQTLDINVQLGDDFDGTIDLGHNSTLDIQHAWDFAGTMNVDNGFVAGTPPFIPSISAGVAYLQGGAIAMNEATTTINVLDADGTLQFDAPFTANGGAIVNNGRIVFNQDATINSGVDFDMNGVDAGMTVGPNATVVINDADMDFDGSGSSTNEIIVEAGGLLDFNLDSFEGNDRFDGYMTLNSGTLHLNVTDGSWTMDRRLTLNNTGGSNPSVSGSAIVVGDDAGFNGLPDADIRVQGNGASQINSPVTWNSDAEVDVEAGATLAVVGFSTFNTVNGSETAQFNGPGDIYFHGGQVNEATTLNFSGGTVGLDGGGALVLLLNRPDFTIDAPLTINAASIDEYGGTSAFPFPSASDLTVNAGSGGELEVNLDNPTDSWRVNNAGIMHANSNDLFFNVFLSGSRLQLDGTLNVDGLNRSDAPMTIGGTVNLIDALANLRTNGGDLVNANRIEGGTINGPGELSLGDGHAMHGYGTIGANIDYDGPTSELMADDGTLTLTGSILDVGVLGTEDSDGVLDVQTPWATSNTARVRLNGGELTGSTITNDGPEGIAGGGLVSARVLNDSILNATGGNTLVVDNPTNNNDWDGPSNSGVLYAVSGGLLELHDNSAFLFNGTVEAAKGTVYANGFELEFDPGSTLRLDTGGTYRSTHATDIGGTVEVLGGLASRIEVPGTVVFENTSNTTLDANLELANTVTRIDSGATFAGGGKLINLPGGTLNLADGADVDVLVQNEGLLTLGASPGQSSGTDFEQVASGQLQIEIAGTGLSDYDRMSLSGIAQLDGTLEVSLLGGHTPALNDSYTLLTAANVLGSFATEDFTGAPLDAGLAWDVIYNPTSVQLSVIEAIQLLFGDADNDLAVSGSDLLAVTNNFGNVGPADGLLLGDADDDGSVSGSDLLAVTNNFGATLPGSLTSAQTVPEPSTLMLFLTTVVAVGICISRSRQVA